MSKKPKTKKNIKQKKSSGNPAAVITVIIIFLLLAAAIFFLIFNGKNDTALTPSVSEPGVTLTAATDLTLGKYDGDVYENEFIGMGYVKEADWRYSEGKDLRKANEISEYTTDEEFRIQATHRDFVQDMYVVGPAYKGYIKVVLEKMEQEELEKLDVAAEFEVLATDMKSGYEEMEYSGIKYEVSKTDISGRTVDVLEFFAEQGEIKMYQKNFYVKCDGYIAMVSAAAFGEDITDQMLSGFYWLD